jgi:hypothetical protein
VEEVVPSGSTFGALVYECTLCIWNKTTVESLVNALSDADIPASSKIVAHTLLKDLAIHLPKIFKNMVPILADFIITEASKVSPNRTREEKEAVEDVLKTLSRLDNLDLPGKQGKEFIDALKTFALDGETEKQGRRATTVLLKLKRHTVYADDLVNVRWSYALLMLGNCPFSAI